VKTHDVGQQFSGVIDYGATLDFVLEDFVTLLPTRKSKLKRPARLASGQRVPSSAFFEITFDLARHDFQRTFYVLRELRVADVVLVLPWLNDEQASLQFGTARVFTLMDGTLETQTEERLHECVLLPSSKVQKPMRIT
jgi:hypothetical protein